LPGLVFSGIAERPSTSIYGLFVASWVIFSPFSADHAISGMNHRPSRKSSQKNKSFTKYYFCQEAKLSDLTEIAPFRIKIL
jgi:hypothetical protein